LEKDLTDANGQVKALQKDCYGLAVIDVSELVHKPARWSAETPPSLAGLIGQTQQCLTKHHSALSAALLIWSDFFVEPIPGQTRRDHVVLQRRTELVRHRQPIRALPSDTTTIEPGFTVEFTVS
jgi:hypothetical protein